MKQLPFLVFKKGKRRFFYVRFKNEQTEQYLPVISTKKKETKAEAIQTAVVEENMTRFQDPF